MLLLYLFIFKCWKNSFWFCLFIFILHNFCLFLLFRRKLPWETLTKKKQQQHIFMWLSEFFFIATLERKWLRCVWISEQLSLWVGGVVRKSQEEVSQFLFIIDHITSHNNNKAKHFIYSKLIFFFACCRSVIVFAFAIFF